MVRETQAKTNALYLTSFTRLASSDASEEPKGTKLWSQMLVSARVSLTTCYLYMSLNGTNWDGLKGLESPFSVFTPTKTEDADVRGG